MVSLIQNKINAACQHINPYLPSKQRLKTAAKITAVSVATFIAVRMGADYYLYNILIKDVYPIWIPWRRVPKYLFNLATIDGISTLSPANLSQIICGYSLSGCYICPKIDPWYMWLIKDITRFLVR